MKNFINWFLITFGFKKKVIKIEDIPLYKNTYWATGEPNDFEIALSLYVNNYRIINKLHMLDYDMVCTTLAKDHSENMVNMNELSHNEYKEREQFLFDNWNAKSYSEIVAYRMTPKTTLQGWLNSPKHKPILNNKSFTKFGISCMKSQSGAYYTTLIAIRK